VLVAIPGLIVTLLVLGQGGVLFALFLAAIGIAAAGELYGLMDRARPPRLAGFLAIAALVLSALFAGREALPIVLVAALPVAFALTAGRPRNERVAWGLAVTFLGVVWIGVPLAHGVLLRELDHGGALVLDVLVGTFVGDSAAYMVGRRLGRRQLAPRISPSKTVEGLMAGVVFGTLAFWGFAVAYQDFISGTDALIIGAAVALAAPAGDLFQSMVKRDLGVKDFSRLFGAHGGALDRVDALLFTVPAAYYAALAVL